MLTQLKQELLRHHIPFNTLRHSPAFTAQEVAHNAHVSGRDLIKTVVVKLDDKLALYALPANQMVNFKRLREFSGADHVMLATEQEFSDHFPGCELGAVPPCGELWDVDLYAEPSLNTRENLLLNAGNHAELIQMSSKDFIKWAHPIIVH